MTEQQKNNLVDTHSRKRKTHDTVQNNQRNDTVSMARVGRARVGGAKVGAPGRTVMNPASAAVDLLCLTSDWLRETIRLSNT